jgi:hypothetical protein
MKARQWWRQCTCSHRPARGLQTVAYEKPPSLVPPSIQTAVVHPEQLHRAYNLFTRPPLTAYAALAARIPSLPESLKSDLEAVEQCCVCESFWIEHRTASKTWLKDWKAVHPTLTHFGDEGSRNNAHLAVLGNEILGAVALEWLEHNWPHLPTSCGLSAFRLSLSQHLTQGPQIGLESVCGQPDMFGRGERVGHHAGHRTAAQGGTGAPWSTHQRRQRRAAGGCGSAEMGKGCACAAAVFAPLMSAQDVTTSSFRRLAESDPSLAPAPNDFQGATYATAMAASSRAFVGMTFQREVRSKS